MPLLSIPHDRTPSPEHPVPLRNERYNPDLLARVSRPQYRRYLREHVPATIVALPLAPDVQRKRRPSRRTVRKRCYGPLRLYNALAVVQHKAGGFENVGSTSLTFDSSVTTNALVVLNCWGYHATANGTMFPSGGASDNKSNTWNFLHERAADFDVSCAQYYAIAATGGASFQVTLDPLTTANYGWWSITEVTGAMTSGVVDQQRTATTNDTAATATSTLLTGTLAQADEIVFACMTSRNTKTSITVDSFSPAFTQITETLDFASYTPGESVYKIVTATAAVNCTWTYVGAGRNSSALTTFKAAASSALLRAVSTSVQVNDAVRKAAALRRRTATTVQVSEVVQRRGTLRRIVASTVQVSEAVLRRTGILRLLASTVQLSETLLRRSSLRRTFSTTVEVSETRARRAALLRQVATVVQVSEALRRTLALRRYVDSTVQVSSAVRATQAMVRALASTVQVATTVLKLNGLTRILGSTVQVTDATVMSLASSITKVLGSVVQASEQLLRSIALTRATNETVEVSETKLRNMALIRLVSSTVQIAEQLLRNISLLRIMSSTVQVSSGLLRRLSMRRSVNSTVEVSETNVRRSVLLRAFSSIVNIGESIVRDFAAPQAFIVIVNDTVQVTSSLLLDLLPLLRRARAVTRRVYAARAGARGFVARITGRGKAVQ